MTHRLTIGVIGHVDHGKTALVRALTGMETDRLEDERRRGMSIVLGFAWFDQGQQRFDLIDTPGHEAFIRTMVLGATGFDAALLVVAADEGVKPQTLEHLAVARVFGLERRLVVAISKIDRLASEDRQARVGELAAKIGELAGCDAPAVGVSGLTGEGMEALRISLSALASRSRQLPREGAFWLPVDRAFNRPGFGLVVTGTLHGGTVRPGDTVELTPGPRQAQVRQLQVHGQSDVVAYPGGRVALNLRGLGLTDLPRGAMVAAPGLVTAADTLDVSLSIDRAVGAALRSGVQVRLMLGAADVGARVRLLGEGVLEPGQAGFARLHLDQPAPARLGARFVLRRPSPALTLGGGTLLDTPGSSTRRPRRGHGDAIKRLAALRSGDGIAATRIALVEAGLEGCPAADVTRWVGAGCRGHDLGATQLRSGRWVDEAALHALVARLNHEPTPLRLATYAARAGAPLEVVEAATGRLVAGGGRRLVEGELRKTEGGEGALDEAVECDFLAAGCSAAKVMATVGDNPSRHAAVGRLIKAGRLVRLRHAQGRHPLLLHAAGLADAEAQIRSAWSDGEPFTVAAVRDALHLTRRDTLPLLEHFDATGVTVRRGDVRRLREAPISGGD